MRPQSEWRVSRQVNWDRKIEPLKELAAKCLSIEQAGEQTELTMIMMSHRVAGGTEKRGKGKQV